MIPESFPFSLHLLRMRLTPNLDFSHTNMGTAVYLNQYFFQQNNGLRKRLVGFLEAFSYFRSRGARSFGPGGGGLRLRYFIQGQGVSKR